MISEDNLIEICTISLTCASQDFLSNISNFLTCPEQYLLLSKTIDNPYVAFSFCLALKNKMTRERSEHSSSVPSVGSSQNALETNLESLIQIAKGTEIYRLITREAEKAQMMHAHTQGYKNIIGRGISKDDCLSIRWADPTHTRKWYESIIYLSLLYTSLNESVIREQKEDSLRWEYAAKKMKDEAIGIVLVRILVEYRGRSEGLTNIFDNLVASIRNCIQGDQLMVTFRTINIFNEMINYLRRNNNYVSLRVFSQCYAQKIMNQALQSLNKLNRFVENTAQIISTIFELYNELYELICQPNEQAISGLASGDIFDEQKPALLLKTMFVVPEWLLSLNRQLIIVINNILSKILTIDFKCIAKSCLTTILKVTSNISDYRDDETLLEREKRKFVQKNFKQNLFQCMHLVISHYFLSVNMRTEEDSNQSLLMETLCEVFNYHIGYGISEEKLMLITVQQLCPTILKMSPVKIEAGANSPISKLFDFLINLYFLAKQMGQDEKVSQYIKGNFDILLDKCCTQENNEDFSNFKEQIQSNEDFFGIIISFAEKIYSKIKGEEKSYLWTLRDKLEIVFNQNPNRGTYLMRLAIQSTRLIQEESIKKFAQEKCQFTLYLLEKLSNFGGFEYLLLLETIVDQLVSNDATQLDDSTSFLWYYISRNSEYNFNKFISYLSNQIILYLTSSQSTYLVQYAIHILAKLCRSIKKVEANKVSSSEHKIDRSVFSTPLNDVSNFIVNLEPTVLNDVHNYEQRVKLFQIIRLLNVKEASDLYTIYGNTIHFNLEKQTETGYLHYLMDMQGLMNVTQKQDIISILLDLILQDLKDYPGVLAIFNKEKLEKEEIYFNLFSNFMIRILRSIRLINHKHSLYTFQLQSILKEKLDLLSEIIDEDNCQEINEIYIAYTCTCFDRFPKLPARMFKSLATTKITGYLFNNLYKLQSVSQIELLYRNVFERYTLKADHESLPELAEQIVDVFELPKYLYLLVEEIQLRCCRVFFDFRRTIQTIIVRLFKAQQEGHSLSGTLDSYGADYDSDFEDEVQKSSYDYVSDFFKSNEYKGKLKLLAKSQIQLEYIESGVEQEYGSYEERFLNNAKILLMNCI